MSSNPFASPSVASFQPDYGKSFGSGLFDALVDHRGWIRLCGIVSIIFGVMLVIGIWTIVIAWLPIWQGIVLINAANLLTPGATAEMQTEAARKLALYFKLLGIFYLVYLGLMLLFCGGYATLFIFMIANGELR